ncbi:MAG: NusG domain II-containing protein [Candidatus Limivicinus sp.]|jgi:hypothetical protein
MDKKTKIWILIFALALLAGIAAYFLVGSADTGTVAVIRVDGEELYRIDLSAVEESYDLNINTKYGWNTVRVEPGKISVSDANCPDLICVNQGAISRGGIPIICAPHHLSIRIEGGGIDG